MKQGKNNDAMDLSVDSSEEGLVTDMKKLTGNSAKGAIKAGYNTLHMPHNIVRFLAGSGDEDGEFCDASLVSISNYDVIIKQLKYYLIEFLFYLKSRMHHFQYTYFGIMLVYLAKMSKLVLLLKIFYG